MAGSSRVFRGGIQELGEGRLGFQQLRDELRRVLEAVAVRVVDLLCVTVPTSAQRMSASRGRKLEFGQPPPCMHTLKNGANLRKTSPNVESLPGERRASFASRDAVNILWSGTSCSTEPNICLKCASLSTLVWKKLRCCRGPHNVRQRVGGRGSHAVANAPCLHARVAHTPGSAFLGSSSTHAQWQGSRR